MSSTCYHVSILVKLYGINDQSIVLSFVFEHVSFDDLRNGVLGIRIYALSGQLLVLLLQLFSHGGS